MNGRPTVTYVVPVYNGSSTISPCLDAITKQTYPDSEIIVVDDASTDDTAARVAAEYPSAKIIRRQEPGGVAAALNTGFKAASGEFIAVINDDARPVGEEWTATMIERCCQADDIGLVCPHVEEPGGTAFSETGDLNYFHGAGFLVREKAAREAGYYDPELFIYGDEIDFAVRLLNAGYRVVGCSEAEVYHDNDSKLQDRRWSSEEMFFITRNALWVQWKYRGAPYLILRTGYWLRQFASRAIRDGTEVAFGRGLIAALKGIPHCLRNREHVRQFDQFTFIHHCSK